MQASPPQVDDIKKISSWLIDDEILTRASWSENERSNQTAIVD